jgi:hypothetical protein
MPSVTIDAGVLAVPLPDSDTNAAHQYVETLLDWYRLLDEPWVAIYMSERASEALLEEGLYPLRNRLKDLFAAHGIVEYDVNTVARVVDTLLQLTPSFEAYFKIHDVLAEPISTTPDILQLGTSSLLQSDLARCIVLIAILRRHCREPVNDHSLIIQQAPRQVIAVRALVYDLEHERDDLNDIPIAPEMFEGDVLVCDDFRGLIECLDESVIFSRSMDNMGLETAIRIALYKSRLYRSEEPDWNDIAGLRIGHRFWETVISCCNSQAASFPVKVLRAIVDTLFGENLKAVHALRTGLGGGNPQRMRNLDKAWRRDIDYEFHLHYWQCEDGSVELASASVHNDFSIPE